MIIGTHPFSYSCVFSCIFEFPRPKYDTPPTTMVEIATSTSPLMTEPLLPQSETPMTPLDTVTHGFNPHAVPAIQPPPKPQPTLQPDIHVWSQMIEERENIGFNKINYDGRR